MLKVSLVSLLSIGCVTTTVWSQELPVEFPAGIPSLLEFSLANPGARSLGLGGAFVALADDATAAFSNPAGLVQLGRPEVSLELRQWHFSTPYVEGGRLSGVPTGFGLDQQGNISEGVSERDANGLSFLSVVYPRDRWSLAFYYHRQLSFESFVEIQGLFGEGAAAPLTPRYPDLRSLTGSRIDSYGVAVGLKLNERWSLGLGVSRSEATLTTDSRFFVPPQSSPNAVFDPTSAGSDERLLSVSLRTDAADSVVNAGLLWQANEHWSFGGFFRQGADYSSSLEVRSGPALGFLPSDTTLLAERVDPQKFPEIYGLGVAYRSRSGSLTLSFEWDHVGYAAIVDSFGRQATVPVDVELDDGNEFHLGAELVLLHRSPLIAFRGGVWLNPDHQVRSTAETEYLQALFPSGEDIWHGAIGIGVAFERVQVDLAVDFSERVDTLALSSIFTF